MRISLSRLWSESTEVEWTTNERKWTWLGKLLNTDTVWLQHAALPTSISYMILFPMMPRFISIRELRDHDCYARRTLGRSKQNQVISREVLTKRRYVLKTTRDSKVKVEWCEGLKPNAQGLKSTLDCAEQEWRLLYKAACYLYYATRKHRMS